MDALTLGVEEELHVVDLSTGRLVPRAPEVIAASRPRLGDLVGCELNRCQVETQTPVCRELDERAGHLRASRRSMADAALPLGLGVVASGTHPFGRWQDQQVDRGQPRYRALEEQYQELARQQVICGCHVHVGVDDRDALVAALTTLRGWLPVLLALSASSPYWQGHDTGYDSFRRQVWRRWPTAGLPPPMYSAAEHDRLVAELVDGGVVPDATFLYWDARPSARYPTLEVRVLDTCLDADDAATIAGLVRALVWTCIHEPDAVTRTPGLLRTEVVDSAMWSAARYGLEGRLFSPETGPADASTVVEELLARCRRGLRVHGDTTSVTAGLARILERGNGATAQRRAVAAHAGDEVGATAELLAATVEGRCSATADVA
jgi:carboxylate-amine ligase